MYERKNFEDKVKWVGVDFNYHLLAFVFEKPVITMQFDVDLIGTEANDLPYPVWELGILNKIGQQISMDQLDQLPDIINKLANNERFKQNIIQLRDEHLLNYTHSGDIIANQLIDIMHSLEVLSEEPHDLQTFRSLRCE